MIPGSVITHWPFCILILPSFMNWVRMLKACWLSPAMRSATSSFSWSSCFSYSSFSSMVSLTCFARPSACIWALVRRRFDPTFRRLAPRPFWVATNRKQGMREVQTPTRGITKCYSRIATRLVESRKDRLIKSSEQQKCTYRCDFRRSGRRWPPQGRGE